MKSVVDIIYRPSLVVKQLRDFRKVILNSAFRPVKAVSFCYSIVLRKYCSYPSTSHSACSQVIYKVIGARVNQSEYMFDLSSVHCNYLYFIVLYGVLSDIVVAKLIDLYLSQCMLEQDVNDLSVVVAWLHDLRVFHDIVTQTIESLL